MSKGRWFSCAPARFEGNAHFFSRDSGLLCRGLQNLGYESKVVMLGPGFENESPDIVRGTMEQLASVKWWRELALDGVIVVGWALGKHTPIVRAIVKSGTKLVLQTDGSHTGYPIWNFVDGIKTALRRERDMEASFLTKALSFFRQVVLAGGASVAFHTYQKYDHLRHGDVVTCLTPIGVRNLQRLFEAIGGKDHPINIKHFGPPIPQVYGWESSIPKKRKIVVIGRWDDFRYKRPFTLLAVCEELARRQPDVTVDIFGGTSPSFLLRYERIQPEIRKQICVRGFQPPEVIALAIQEAQILFCPSSSESGPLALFEGLTCGLTGVAIRSSSLPGFLWAESKGHATLASEDTTESYVAALEESLEKWARGEYNPAEISAFWTAQTSLERYLRDVIQAADDRRSAMQASVPSLPVN